MGGKKKVDSEVVKVRMKLPLQKRCKDLQELDSEWKMEQFSSFLAHLFSLGADVEERRRVREEAEALPSRARTTPRAVGQE